jgi:hypothetical protein
LLEFESVRAGTSSKLIFTLFVNQLVFCFFANSVKLLPESFFPKLLKRAGQRPDKTQEYFNSLFEAMEHGGEFDLTDIAHFNGGLGSNQSFSRYNNKRVGER